MSEKLPNSGEIIIYQNSNGNIKIDVRLEDETVWLTQAHLCNLFQKSKPTISEHISNIFKEGELTEDSVVRKFRTTAPDGKSYDTKFYNLQPRCYYLRRLQGKIKAGHSIPYLGNTAFKRIHYKRFYSKR